MVKTTDYQQTVATVETQATILQGQTDSNAFATRGMTLAALETDDEFPAKTGIQFLGKIESRDEFKILRDITGDPYQITARPNSLHGFLKYDFSGVDEIKLRLTQPAPLTTVIFISASTEG